MGPPAGTERFRRGHCIIGRLALTRCRIPGYIVGGGGRTPRARANGGSPEMFRIGSVPIDPPLILAPMAGITDQYFRRILKRIGGVGLVCMEFISSEALTRGSERTRSLMHFHEEERPLAIQIYGSDPVRMSDAAQFVQALGA